MPSLRVLQQRSPLSENFFA